MVVVSSIKSNWSSSQESIWLNDFINRLKNRIECPLSKLGNGIKLVGAPETQCRARLILRGDLEKWAFRCIIKFDKCKY